MKNVLAVLTVCLALTSTEPQLQRIVVGSPTTIQQYPFAVVVLYGTTSFSQWCGGSILTTRSVLTAAHCFYLWGSWLPATQFRQRVGSTFASSGGTVHQSPGYVPHPLYNINTFDNDVAIIFSSTAITYISNTVTPVSIAGASYNVLDNAAVWAIGWGDTQNPSENPETLRHVQVFVINQTVCRQRYATRGISVTDDILCSGVLDVGGRDQCQRDSGGPLLHNNVQVDICSWGLQCADAFFPGVNARVSSYTSRIVANA